MQYLKIILSVSGLIALGFIAGFFTHRYIAVQKIDKLRELNRAPGFERHLYRMIRPTEEQKAQLDPIVMEYAEKMAAHLQRTQAERRSMIDSLHEQIKPLLTPEQIEQLDRFEQRFRQRHEHDRRNIHEKRRLREKRQE